MKIALFQPWLKSKGGSERVILEFIKNTKHDVDLYTYGYDEKNTFEEFKKFKHKIFIIGPSFLKQFKFKGHISRLVSFLLPFFSKISLEKYDLFLISTAGYTEFILFRNYKKGKTFAYVHSPLKAASKNLIKWNLKYRVKGLMKIIYLIFVVIYRFLEKIAWKRINVAIFNSRLTFERAKERNLLKNKKKYIVYPCINLRIKKYKSHKNYFLYVSRFSIQKRQNVLVSAWEKFVKKHPEYKLILAGYPTEIEIINTAKKIKNVEIIINPSEKQLSKLYSNALACFFVGIGEDFGIAPFEALSAGKTLIAVDRGGYVDIIKKAPAVIWIKESFDNKILEKNIYKALEEFVKKKEFYIKKAVRNREWVKNLGLDSKSFAKKIDEILETSNKIK